MTAPLLLAEDDANDAELFRRAAIAGGDPRIVVVRDGAEAWTMLDRGLLYPGVIFLDLKMPRMTGLEVLQRVRADVRFQHLPVVVITSSGEPRDILAAYHAGATSYVHKPTDAEDYERIVSELIRYWGFLNAPPPVDRQPLAVVESEAKRQGDATPLPSGAT